MKLIKTISAKRMKVLYTNRAKKAINIYPLVISIPNCRRS